MRIGVYPGWVERNPAQLRDLEAKAADLGVIVSTRHLDTRHEPDGTWLVRVRKGEQVHEMRERGPLYALISAAMDDWYEAQLFTADELVQIQRQSA